MKNTHTNNNKTTNLIKQKETWNRHKEHNKQNKYK